MRFWTLLIKGRWGGFGTYIEKRQLQITGIAMDDLTLIGTTSPALQ